MNEETLHDVRPLAVKSSTTQELITELKRRGLGVFNLDMPFQYMPVVKHGGTTVKRGGKICRSKTSKKHRK